MEVKAEDAQEFAQALGQVAAGAVRLAKFGVEKLNIPPSLLEHSMDGALRLSASERRAVVAANPEAKPEDLAEALGVGRATIYRDRDRQDVSNETKSLPNP